MTLDLQKDTALKNQFGGNGIAGVIRMDCR